MGPEAEKAAVHTVSVSDRGQEDAGSNLRNCTCLFLSFTCKSGGQVKRLAFTVYHLEVFNANGTSPQCCFISPH